MQGSIQDSGVEISWLNHASIKLKDEKGFVIYIDPWSEAIKEKGEEANLIISTHDHFDHFDPDIINKLSKTGTKVVITDNSKGKLPEKIDTKTIAPEESLKLDQINIKGVYAYNVDKFREENKPFHPKGFCTGVIFDLNGLTFYHASDTDPIDEMKELKEKNIDYAFLPIGGHYTMNQGEAVEAVKMVQPEKVIPIHYNFVEKTEADPGSFKEKTEEETDSEVVILED